MFKLCISKCYGGGKYCSYLGKKYGEEKAKILSESDIFVFPTREDCFPLVLLEAMQFGIPSVSTNEGAIPDMLEDAGIIVETRNAEQVAGAIELLIKDKELYRRLSINSFDRFNQKFTLEIFEKDILETLSHAISR